jgi:hypothetical protein
MRRIGLAVVLVLSVVLAPLTDEAQQASKVCRVGFLHWAASHRTSRFRFRRSSKRSVSMAG